MTDNNNRSFISGEDLKTLRFDGNRKKWREWKGRFLALAQMKGYKPILLDQIQVPPDSLCLPDAPTDNQTLAQINARQLNNLAYCTLLTICTDISYELVETAVTDENPDGHAGIAWAALVHQFEPVSNICLIDLCQ